MKLYRVLLGVAPALATCVLQAQITEFDSYTPNLAIPDGNATGASDSHIISGSAITSITALTVNLGITGSFNGDLYLYLRHEQEISPGTFATDGFSVLLNRVGRTTSELSGYDDHGFTVTLSDSAAHDIHTYRAFSTPSLGSPLTDTWQPDGRNTDPSSVLDTSLRNASLAGFDGLNANGRWTLFAADLESGGTSQVDSWQLNFTAVPEPQWWSSIAGLALAGLAFWRRASAGRSR